MDGKIRVAPIKDLFIRLIRNPLEQVLSNQVKSAASIARQLDKVEPIIIFNDPGFSIDKSAHDLMNNIFTHLIRNSIDHGIELPENRIKVGKPEQGTLSFALTKANSQLVIRFGDDGQGLNLPAIYDSAVKGGVIDENDPINPEFVANLIFASGFSTAKQVSGISGRGVGMDAVRHFLEKENCSIEIRVLETSDAELKLAPFEFIITLPTNLFQYMGEETDTI